METPVVPSYQALRWGLLLGSGACLVLAAYGVLMYPALLQDGGVVFLGILTATIVGYSALSLVGTHPTTAETRIALRDGIRWGMLISLLWLIEILAGNVGDPHQWWVMFLYVSSTVLAFTLPFVAGMLAALQTGKASTGAWTGGWSGLINGLSAYIGLMLLIYGFMNIALHDPQNLQQYQQSHAANLATFIVGDALAGAINHLWFVGPFLGTITGWFGGLLGKSIRYSSKSET